MNLTIRQKLLPRLLINGFKQPLQKTWNFVKYDWQCLNSCFIDYVPPVIVATITERCNLRCPTCLYLLQAPNYFDKKNEIEVNEFKQVLNRINSEKASIIWLDGGEPLLHSHFEELVAITNKKGLSVRISTNGILIEEKIQGIKNLDYINVSLDAWDSRSFKEYRSGSETVWQKIIKGIRLLEKEKVNFSVSFLLSESRLKYLPNMVELLDRLSLKPNTVHFHNINPHGNTDEKSVTVYSKDLHYIDRFLMVLDDYPYDIVVSHVFDPGSKAFKTKRCIQPWYYFCFNQGKKISPCCHSSYYIHNDNWSNSTGLISFRNSIKKGIISKDCLFCHRRFIGDNYAIFNSRKKKWK